MRLPSPYWTVRLAWEARQQAEFPFLPYEAILARQRARLRKIIAYAYRHIPFYREEMRARGLTPDDFHTVEDLERLPLVERGTVQQAPERFCSEIIPKEKMLYTHSSGSIGIPLEVWHDHRAILENATHGERQRTIYTRFIGKSLGYRETVLVAISSVAGDTQGFVASHLMLPRAMRIQRQYLKMADSFEHNVREIQRFQPHVLHSHGSYLSEFFPYLYACGITLPFLKLVTFSSDPLAEGARRLIETEFGLPVFGTYQTIEAFQIGFECEVKRGYHLNIDLYPLRIVDEAGHTLPAGEMGEVVISNLVNRGTVLLNYRLRDLATLSTEPCPCGRNLPLLKHIEGRSDEFVPLASGGRAHPTAVRTLFIVHPEICQFQILVLKNYACDVRLIVRPDCDRESLEHSLRTAWQERFGEALRLRHISYIREIPRPPGGKPRIIVPYDSSEEPSPNPENRV